MKNDTTERIIPLNPGLMTAFLFPALLGILTIIGAMTLMVHYPENIKVRAVITGVEDAGNTIVIEADIPPKRLSEIDTGLATRIRFDVYPYNHPIFIEGTLKGILQKDQSGTLKAKMNLHTKPDNGIREKGICKSGERIDLLITVKDMCLLQRIFYHAPN